MRERSEHKTLASLMRNKGCKGRLVPAAASTLEFRAEGETGETVMECVTAETHDP